MFVVFFFLLVQSQSFSPDLAVTPSLKRERSLSPSTLSLESDREYQSDSSFGFPVDTQRPPTSKSSRYTNSHLWDDFSFPTPPGLQNNKDIPDSIRKQVIRDVYTCMRAKCGDEKISSNDFITVAKIVCKRIPQLKVKEPVGLKLRGDFTYWVSAINMTSH